MIIDKTKFHLLCAERCLKFKDVLEQSKCSRYVVQKINDGKNLAPFTVGKIAKVLGVPVVDIIVKEGG